MDFRALSIYVEFLRIAIQGESYRRRTMPPLIEIKGLSETIASVTKQIRDVRNSSARVNEVGSLLKTELDDVGDQLQKHREDLRFHAATLGNSGETEKQ